MPTAGSSGSGFRTSLRDRLPLPLAGLYRRAHNAKSRLERHGNALYLLEATVKLAAASQVAIYLGSRVRQEAVDRRLAHLALPSFGHWAEFLRTISLSTSQLEPHPFPELSGVAAALREEREDLPAIAALLSAMGERVRGIAPFARVRVRGIDLLDRLPAYRNQVLGHGAIRGEPFYAEMGDRLLDAAVELLDRVPLLGRSVLVYAGEAREAQVGLREVDLWDLIGPEALRADAQACTASECPGHLYLRAGGAFLDLHPLVICDPAPPEASVLFLNRSRTDGSLEYLDYITGETSSQPHLLEAHRQALFQVLWARISSGEWSQLEECSRKDDEEPALSEAPTGTRRLGDFDLLGRIGEGGMGAVYRARQRSLDRIVAVKSLPPALSRDPVAVERFQREVRALSRADHPNVVRVLQSGKTEGTDWFAMEYVEGGDLRAVAAALGKHRLKGALTELDLDRALREAGGRSAGGSRARKPHRTCFVRLAKLFVEAARGLEHLHQRGVIHRDVKPSNLMATEDGRLVVTDLGLARLAGEESLTSPAQVLGTVPYAAPEQLQHALLDLDARADVYGLGATLYELATGRPPYRGTTAGALIARILREPPPAPRLVDRTVPRELDAIIQKAMERNPARRYAGARALADDLQRFVVGEPVGARPPGIGRRAARLLSRRRTTVAACAVLALMLLLGVVLQRQALGERHQARTRWILENLGFTIAPHASQTEYRSMAVDARRWHWLRCDVDAVFQIAFFDYLRREWRTALETLDRHRDLVEGDALLLDLRALLFLETLDVEGLKQTEGRIASLPARNPTIGELCFRAFRLISRAERVRESPALEALGEAPDRLRIDALLAQALEVNPDHRLALALQGFLSFARKAYREALRDFERIPAGPSLPEKAATSAWRAAAGMLAADPENPVEQDQWKRAVQSAEEAWRFERGLFDWIFRRVLAIPARAYRFYFDAAARWRPEDQDWVPHTLRNAGALAPWAAFQTGRDWVSPLVQGTDSLWRNHLPPEDVEAYHQLQRAYVWRLLPKSEDCWDPQEWSDVEHKALKILRRVELARSRGPRLTYDLDGAEALATAMLALVAGDPGDRKRFREEAVRLRQRLLDPMTIRVAEDQGRYEGEREDVDCTRKSCEARLRELLGG